MPGPLPGQASWTFCLPSLEAVGKARAAWRGAGWDQSPAWDSGPWGRVTLLPGRCLWYGMGACGSAQVQWALQPEWAALLRGARGPRRVPFCPASCVPVLEVSSSFSHYLLGPVRRGDCMEAKDG